MAPELDEAVVTGSTHLGTRGGQGRKEIAPATRLHKPPALNYSTWGIKWYVFDYGRTGQIFEQSRSSEETDRNVDVSTAKVFVSTMLSILHTYIDRCLPYTTYPSCSLRLLNHIHIPTHPHANTHKRILTRTYVHTHAHTHTHMYAHMHTYVQKFAQSYLCRSNEPLPKYLIIPSSPPVSGKPCMPPLPTLTLHCSTHAHPPTRSEVIAKEWQ